MSLPSAMAHLGWIDELLIRYTKGEYTYSQWFTFKKQEFAMCAPASGKALYFVPQMKVKQASETAYQRHKRALRSAGKLFKLWHAGAMDHVDSVKLTEHHMKKIGHCETLTYLSFKWDDDSYYIHKFEKRPVLYVPRRLKVVPEENFLKKADYFTLAGAGMKVTSKGIIG